MTKQLPLYQCHKQVRALEIMYVDVNQKQNKFHVRFVDKSYPEKTFCFETHKRNIPRDGDYYVVYDDGYESFSPRKAFEEGYSLITEQQ